jgi:hypothetical protein
MFGFSACRDTVEPFFAVIDGDIVGNRITVDLNGIASTEFTYISDGTEITASGWELNTVITQVELLYEDNYLMITATDGVSALIDAALTGAIYLYYGEGGVLSAKTSDYPSVCSIKDIAEITVITKETAIDGYKILSRDETEFVSRGNAKLRLFNRIAENLMNGNIAYKYLPKADRSVSSFTMKEDDVVYFTDYDIIKNADLKMLEWKNGGLIIEIGQTEKIVFGFAAGTDLMVYDAYDQMKSALDGGEKVMFILPDGLSWQQAEYFSEYLNTLDLSNASLALTVNTAISPVALASIVTGETPYVTGINFGPGEARAILKPLVSDIFDYAVSIGKSVSYLEGNGNLIVTNVLPEYALSDALVFENAKSAINADTDLIFVHFHEIDDVNHDYGPLSNESKTKIIYIESYIEYLISQFDGTVIIVPDHGHITLYDEQEKPYGKHGLFTNLDMFIPYYVFGEDE